jgi:iron complex transport system substrate-binding protein
MRVLLLVLALLCAHIARAEESRCARIVSMAPSVTEVVFDLGLGDRLVGVTRFCRYPPEAARVRSIGGFFDVSLENLVSLKPTLVVGLRENQEVERNLRSFKIPMLVVDHTSLAGIKASYEAVGRACGVEELAKAKLQSFAEREERVRTLRHGAAPLRTLVVVGRTHEGSDASGVYVSGSDGFYADLLPLLGLTNVNKDPTISLPLLSAEGITALSPEVIVEIVNRDDVVKEDAAAMWTRYSSVPAVRDGRVFVLSEDYASIPGPRYILLAELLAQKVTAPSPRQEVR